MNGIRAVGFDLDGTFMNTRVDYVRLNSTDRTVCISHGVPFDEIDFGDSPKRLREPIRRWMEDNGRGSEYPELSREIDDALTECECEFADEATPFPGSVECLGRLRDMGYRTGLLTRGSLAYAKRVDTVRRRQQDRLDVRIRCRRTVRRGGDGFGFRGDVEVVRPGHPRDPLRGRRHRAALRTPLGAPRAIGISVL